MKQNIYPATVSHVVSLNDFTCHFVITFPGGRPFDFQPGQFIEAYVPQEEKTIRKPYSIACPPHLQDCIELCINRVPGGYASNWFCDLKGGEPISIEGPYGKFVLKSPVEESIFVATGTGVAPFRSMIYSLIHQNHPGAMWLFLGIRYEQNILYQKEFEQLAQQHPNFHFIPTISRPTEAWRGERGYVQEKVRQMIHDPRGKDVYICGLNPMVNDTKKALLEMGFLESQIHFEKYV